MSNVETPPPAAPAAPTVAETITAQQAGVAPGDIAGYVTQARYDAEISNHQRERNIYKPAQQLLRDLDEDSQQHLMALADAARRGDTAAILDLTMGTAETVAAQTGQSIADIIAARQTAGRFADPAQPPAAPPAAPGQATAPTPGMTAAEVATIVQNQIKMQAVQQEVSSTLSAAGFPLDTASGKAIIQYCFENRCAPQVGIDWFKADLVARGYAPAAASAAAAAAATGMALPGTAPAGQAASGAAADNLSSHDRAVNRVKEWQSTRANGTSI